jgi:elongation factor Ts
VEITASQVKALREKTGAGMMDCRAALSAAGGDMEGAVRHLREKGLATAAKRAGRVAAEGAIVSKLVSPSEGILLELNCETDFVAKTEPFQALAQSVLETLAGNARVDGCVTAAEVGLDDATLASGKRVGDAIADSIASLGESIVARRVARLASAPGTAVVGGYVHAGGKIGVLVEARSTASGAAAGEVASLLRDVAMQIAAANPRCVRREEVAAAEIEREREIYRTQAAATGKPAPSSSASSTARWRSSTRSSACSSRSTSATRSSPSPSSSRRRRSPSGRRSKSLASSASSSASRRARPEARAGRKSVAQGLAYRRVLVKMSGEALAGASEYGIDDAVLQASRTRSGTFTRSGSRSPW